MCTGRARLAQASLLAGVLGVALAMSADARAYVRSTSPTSGKPFTWLVGCLVVKPDSRGSQDLTIDQINATLAKAASNWSTRTNGCSDLRLTTQLADGPLETVADGQPSVVFRDKVWAKPGGIMHSPFAIGITTVSYLPSGEPGDATIVDADIELNGVFWTFAIEPSTVQKRSGTYGIADLENTLTHELGHVQGLAHTCWDQVTDTPPLDDKGRPIPDCRNPSLPTGVVSTTMYPYSSMDGETSKRMLSDDDVRGVCEVYPSSAPMKACFQRTSGGCDVGETRTRPAWLLALGVVAAAIFLQRIRSA